MAKTHAMTPKRKAALRKAQLASARKRRGRGKGKLAKANRQTRTARRVALAAATGGLVLAAAGVAGAYYARKTAGGGPKAKKINHSAHAKYQTRGQRTLLPKTSPSVDPGFTRRMGKPYTGDPGFSMRPSKPFTGDPGFTRRVGAPRSGGTRAVFLRAQFRGLQSAQSRWRNRKTL